MGPAATADTRKLIGLRVGSKNVAVKWSDLKLSRDDRSIVITTNWTKDSLKAMPDYKYERRQPVNRAGG